MDNRVVTVSREFGSGGRTIGRQLAAKLNIPCYDYELIDKVAEESGFARSYIAEHGEYAAYGSRIGNALLSGHFVNGVSRQQRVAVGTLRQRSSQSRLPVDSSAKGDNRPRGAGTLRDYRQVRGLYPQGQSQSA